MSENTTVVDETEKTAEETEKRSGSGIVILLTVIGFVFVVAVMFLMRSFVFNSDIFYAISEGRTDQYYIPAYIGDNGAIFFNYLSVRNIYLTGLSCLFKFSGNVEDFIFIYDLALELLALIFLFFALKRVFGRIASFVFSLLIACYPAFILLSGIITGTYYVLLWRDERIIYLAGAIGLWILSFIAAGIRKSIRKKKTDIAGDKAVSEDAEGAAERPVKAGSGESNDAFAPEVNVVLSEDGMLIDEIKDENKVELLISPLPGPGKPKHKELDFDYEIDEDKMKYDIEVEDTAEFDHE